MLCCLLLQIEAMRKEAAASAEALASERAAKFAADAEARELQKFLDETKAALEQERKLTERLETDAERTQRDLKAALASKEDLVMNNKGLTNVVLRHVKSSMLVGSKWHQEHQETCSWQTVANAQHTARAESSFGEQSRLGYKRLGPYSCNRQILTCCPDFLPVPDIKHPSPSPP